MIKIFQIYFDKKSASKPDGDFIPYPIDYRDEFFENSVIRKIYEDIELWKDAAYIGITSWKQHRKTHLSGKEIIDVIQKDIDAGIENDIYVYSPVQTISHKLRGNSFHANIQLPDVWNTHRVRSKQLFSDDQMLNNSGVLPFDLFDGKWQYCYCNYWIVKPHVFEDYCKNVLIPAMDFYNRPEVIKTMPKWYTHRHEERKTTSICFTLEGLFGSYMAHNTQYSFDYIVKKRIKKHFHMIKIDGYEKIVIHKNI